MILSCEGVKASWAVHQNTSSERKRNLQSAANSTSRKARGTLLDADQRKAVRMSLIVTIDLCFSLALVHGAQNMVLKNVPRSP